MRRMRICFTDVFFCFFVRHKNTRQPFSGTAERIFMKLLPNDSGENVVSNVVPKWGLGPQIIFWGLKTTHCPLGGDAWRSSDSELVCWLWHCAATLRWKGMKAWMHLIYLLLHWWFVVDPGFGEFIVMPGLNHLNICKPYDRGSLLYQKTVQFIRRSLPMSCDPAAAGSRSHMSLRT